MSLKSKFYPEVAFGSFTRADTTVAFYSRVNALISESTVVLDIGCGRGAYGDDPVKYRRDLRILKGKCAKVIGMDMDKNAAVNKFIDEFKLLEDNEWPIENNSIDLIVCDYVVEHIEDPEEFFNEISRVLRPGGFACIRTPNKWSYISLAATLIPDKLHSKVTSFVQENRKPEDVFPTHYKCNTASKLKRFFTQRGMLAVAYCHEPEPAYLSFSSIAYFFGVIHQKLAPSIIKPVIYAFAQKTPEN